MGCIILKPSRGAALAAALLLLAACARTGGAPPPRAVGFVEMSSEEGWRGVASAGDAAAIAALPATFAAALAAARAAGFGRQIEAEGALLEPAAALPRAAPAPGSYRCRVLAFGQGRRAFVRHREFFCHVGVNDGQLSLTKQTGSDRPGGYLWETQDDSRLVFLGGIALGREDAPPAYGERPERDFVGILQRWDDFRYRLLVPEREGWKLQVIELVAAPPED